MGWSERYYGKHKRETDVLRDVHGEHHVVHLGLGNGWGLSGRTLGQRSGQPRDIQDAFTRVFYADRRHDWIPVWYQIEPERRRKEDNTRT